ncbi:unnamed protein product [Rhizophagus irregularis]|nr:unnamed protein product [Rhizophagus irregularis]CAB5352498.1 unnamed protein product [Rhizophagus irregularis]
MDIYISREGGSGFPAVQRLGIGATNARKKVMIRGWLQREKVSVTLPNIFDGIKPCIRKIDTETFVVVDKSEYDVVLGNNWLVRLGYGIDKRDARYLEKNEEKRLYYTRNDIDILSPSLYTFYELLFPNFTAINSDGEVIITKFFKHYTAIDNLDLSEYYDSEYSETDSETESEDEYVYSNNNMPFHLRYSD